eukprot:8553837-Lingulodinium_polyedra.AAC.1
MSVGPFSGSGLKTLGRRSVSFVHDSQFEVSRTSTRTNWPPMLAIFVGTASRWGQRLIVATVAQA